MVLGVCHDVLHHHQDAEDAAQATFLILAKHGRSIRRADSLASWLYGVALRVSARSKVEAARRRAMERRGAEMNAQTQPSGSSELSARLHEELSRVPEKYRAPIVLCHLEGLSNEQAALQLGVPVRTVQRRLAQGRERLRLRMIRCGADPSAALLATGSAARNASDAWLLSTVRAGSGLAAGQDVAAAASAAVAVLTDEVLSMMFIARAKSVAAGVAAAAAIVAAFAGASVAIAGKGQAARLPGKSEATQAGAGADSAKTTAGRPDPHGAVDQRGGSERGCAPVGGARVSSFWTLDPEVVTTKADGTFAIPNSEPRLSNISVLATAEGGAVQGVFRFDDPATGPKDPRALVRVVLKPARTVTVSVADQRRAPVAGATVSVLDLVFPVATGQTDARGNVVLQAPANALTQWIVGYKSGVGFDYFENYRSVPPGFAPPPESLAWC